MVTKSKMLVFGEAHALNEEGRRQQHRGLTYVDVTNEEWSSAESAIEKFAQFKDDLRLFSIVSGNYREYTEALQDFDQYDAHQLKMGLITRDISLEINRLVLNLLASMRMYIDHVETTISRRHGKESPQFAAFKRVAGEVYDREFAYRFISQLRNYAQHCGLPIDIFEVSSALQPDGTVRVQLEFGTHRDAILQRFTKLKPALRPEVEGQPEIIEVRQSVKAVMRGLVEIHEVFIKNEFEVLRPAAGTIDVLVQQYQGPASTMQVGAYEFELRDGNEPLAERVTHAIGNDVSLHFVRAVLNADIDSIRVLNLSLLQ